MLSREEYTTKIKQQLDEFNAKVDELQARTQETKADAREKYEAEMAKLRHQSELAVAKLDELKAAGEDSWDKVVAEMEKIRDAFVHSFSYFKSQVK